MIGARFEDRYAETLAASGAVAARARAALAGDATHDSWRFEPFPPSFVAADGPRKYDVSGRDYIDFWMGHGALLLGHGPREVTRAVAEQLQRGCHFGGLHPQMVEWAERVVQLVPSAERVRFTASGTEAVQLALRIARAFTGRERILRLDGHYHGWGDELLAHVVPPGAGLSPAAGDLVDVADPFDLDGIAYYLADEDVAALILEPGGGSNASLPWSPEHLRNLREITRRHGTLLIFDEVVSGFRYAPGGVQAIAGVIPDLTVLAKILCGGLPGGAVAGSAVAMAVFGPGTARPHGHARVIHAGTFNANPLSAAAGIATLDLIADGTAQHRADVAATQLCDGVNLAASRAAVDVRLFRVSSTFHLLLGSIQSGVDPSPSAAAMQLMAKAGEAHALLRRCLLLEGIDMHPTHGWLSAAHDRPVIDEAISRFQRAFMRLPRVAPFALPDSELPSCVGYCLKPECACRVRKIAGCDLPIHPDLESAAVVAVAP